MIPGAFACSRTRSVNSGRAATRAMEPRRVATGEGEIAVMSPGPSSRRSTGMQWRGDPPAFDAGEKAGQGQWESAHDRRFLLLGPAPRSSHRPMRTSLSTLQGSGTRCCADRRSRILAAGRAASRLGALQALPSTTGL